MFTFHNVYSLTSFLISPILLALQPSTTTATPDMVSRDDYNDMKKERDSFTIATGVLGALCALFLLLLVIVYIRMRRKQNAIV